MKAIPYCILSTALSYFLMSITNKSWWPLDWNIPGFIFVFIFYVISLIVIIEENKYK